MCNTICDLIQCTSDLFFECVIRCLINRHQTRDWDTVTSAFQRINGCAWFELQSIYIRDSRCKWLRWKSQILRFTKYRYREDSASTIASFMMSSCTNDRAVTAQFAIEKMCLWCEIHQQIYKLRVRIASHWFISQHRRCLWARWYDRSYSMPLTGRYYWTVPNCALINVGINRRLRIYVSDACEVLKLEACCWALKMRFQRCAKKNAKLLHLRFLGERNSASRDISDEHCAGTQAQMTNSARVCRLGRRDSLMRQWPRGVRSDVYLQLSKYLIKKRAAALSAPKKNCPRTRCVAHTTLKTLV